MMCHQKIRRQLVHVDQAPCERFGIGCRSKVPGFWMVVGFGMMGVVGCGPGAQSAYNPAYVPQTVPSSYEDETWATVLRENVREGRVDYQNLSAHRESLERYLGQVSVLGPQSTSPLFASAAEQVCYYLNVYNACVLKAVLQQYPISTAYRLERTSLKDGYIFRVDRRDVTLRKIRANLEQAGQGDVRLIFCLSSAALGSPELLAEPFRPESLREQIQSATQKALDNSQLIQIDRASGQVRIWHEIVNEREKFLSFFARMGGGATPSLLEVLAAMAGPQMREELKSVQGFSIKRLPFNRQLNDLAE